MSLYQVLSGAEFNKQFSNHKFVKLTYESEIHNKDKFKIDKFILGERTRIRELKEWDDDNFCLEAVKQSCDAFKYVKNQTEQICLEAIRINWYALQFVHNQTKQICLASINKNWRSL